MAEQLTLIEQRPDLVPAAIIPRLAKLSRALLTRTTVVVGMEVNGEASAPLAGYQSRGNETRRALTLPTGHAGRWARFFWHFLAEDGTHRGALFNSDAVLDFVTDAKDDIVFTDAPAPRQYSPATPYTLKTGHTYELQRGGMELVTVYGVDQAHLSLTTLSVAQPLIVTPAAMLLSELQGTEYTEYTNGQPSQ